MYVRLPDVEAAIHRKPQQKKLHRLKMRPGDAAASETEEATEEEADTAESEDADQMAADNVAALIDAIYVQERTENTDQQCADAKVHGML